MRAGGVDHGASLLSGWKEAAQKTASVSF